MSPRVTALRLRNAPVQAHGRSLTMSLRFPTCICPFPTGYWPSEVPLSVSMGTTRKASSSVPSPSAGEFQEGNLVGGSFSTKERARIGREMEAKARRAFPARHHRHPWDTSWGGIVNGCDVDGREEHVQRMAAALRARRRWLCRKDSQAFAVRTSVRRGKGGAPPPGETHVLPHDKHVAVSVRCMPKVAIVGR
jgi:hypothetical protein